MDYSIYRLNSYSEIEAYIEKYGDRFKAFINAVYGALMELKPGERYVIDEHVIPANREKFVKVAGMFIIEQKANDYEFTPDWTAVRRLEPFKPVGKSLEADILPWHLHRQNRNR